MRDIVDVKYSNRTNCGYIEVYQYIIKLSLIDDLVFLGNETESRAGHYLVPGKMGDSSPFPLLKWGKMGTVTNFRC